MNTFLKVSVLVIACTYVCAGNDAISQAFMLAIALGLAYDFGYKSGFMPAKEEEPKEKTLRDTLKTYEGIIKTQRAEIRALQKEKTEARKRLIAALGGKE